MRMPVVSQASTKETIRPTAEHMPFQLHLGKACRGSRLPEFMTLQIGLLCRARESSLRRAFLRELTRPFTPSSESLHNATFIAFPFHSGLLSFHDPKRPCNKQ